MVGNRTRLNSTGIEATAAVLGHSLGVIIEVYAEAVFEKAIEVMREMG
jgi:hypothetical protein